eukprot:gb/GECG01014979.1/.p1 GENE.gb/GECG01014979.1/~~gb/GECG01014979.1/.p1  ORF type:complete len:686 (+),score=79.24 gb/GECG01014979.1/:1-2058(+)
MDEESKEDAALSQWSNLNGAADKGDRTQHHHAGGTEGEQGGGHTEKENRHGVSEPSALAKQTTEETWREKVYIIYVTIVGAIGGLLFGYDTGVVSGALLQIETYFELDDVEKEAVVSITVLGAILGSSCSGSIGNRVGRKPVVMVASLIFIGGAVLMGLAQSLFTLLAGRLIVGLAIGQASMVVPMYIAEMAPSKYRGRLVTVNTLFITGGQFLAALVGGAFSGQSDGWRWMLGLGAAPAGLQFLGMFGLPESPRHLVAMGKIDKARKALEILRGRKRQSRRYVYSPYGTQGATNEDAADSSSHLSTAEEVRQPSRSIVYEVDEPGESFDEGEERKDEAVDHSSSETSKNDLIEQELMGIEKAIEDEVREQGLLAFGPHLEGTKKMEGCWKLRVWYKATKQLLSSRAVRNALIVGCTLQFLQQAAGINTVMYYSGTILHNAGFENPTAIWLTAAVAFTNFLFSSLGLRFVETSGRRKLTLFSVAGVALALMFLGAVFFEKRENSATALRPKSHDIQGVCGEADNCFDCVIQDSCGFLGNSTSGFCLKGGHEDYENFSGKIPQGYDWEFSRCVGGLQKDLGWAALTALMFYLMCFAPGLASMPWTINSEIYPNRVRAVAVSIATTVNWIFNLVVSMTFLNLATAITPFGSFGLYAGVAVLGGVFLFFRLPETKGRTLEEIQELFNS